MVWQTSELLDESLLRCEVWIKVILFVEDTDLPQLAKTSTLLQNLTRDIIVRKKLRQRVSQRLDRALFRIPQRCTRIQLARLNVLRGPPGLHRRLNQGEYLGATVATYNAIHERNREDLRRHLNRALQKRPSNDDFILIQVTAVPKCGPLCSCHSSFLRVLFLRRLESKYRRHHQRKSQPLPVHPTISTGVGRTATTPTRGTGKFTATRSQVHGFTEIP
ncbi:hypothetical protein BC830DRAFT_304632 [Chytriomyces sp. MP71]|nr:hypothetical protein BC830DRAFT_304632 [Chytriomyces sp. MP71]